jgi:hypothetical protein
VAFWAWRLAPENDAALIIGSVYFAFAMSRDIRARGQTNIYAIGPIVADCAVAIEGEDAGLVVSLPEEADLRTRTSHFQASEEFRVTPTPRRSWPAKRSVAYRPPKKQTILVSIAHGRPAHSPCIAEKSRFDSSVQHPDLLTDRQFRGKLAAHRA